MSVTFGVPASSLETSVNGPITSGGAVQYQLTEPVPIGKGSFLPSPR